MHQVDQVEQESRLMPQNQELWKLPCKPEGALSIALCWLYFSSACF